MFSMCCHCIHITCTYCFPCLFIIFMSIYICISQVKSVQLLLYTYPSKFYILLSQWYCNVFPDGFCGFSIVVTTVSQFFLLFCFSCWFFPFLAWTRARTLHWLSSNPTIRFWTPWVHPAVVRYKCRKSCNDWHWMIWEAHLIGNCLADQIYTCSTWPLLQEFGHWLCRHFWFFFFV
jgi:hypothetical protein